MTRRALSGGGLWAVLALALAACEPLPANQSPSPDGTGSATDAADPQAAARRSAIELRLARAHRELALALEAAGDAPGAIRHHEAALAAARRAGPEGASTGHAAHEDLLRLCRSAAAPEAVVAACTAALAGGLPPPPALPGLLLARAKARASLGQLDGARSDVEAVLKVATGQPEALLLRGRLRLDDGEAEGAEADFRRVVILGGPLAAEARLWRARALARFGRPDEALAELDAAIGEGAAALHGAAWRERAAIDCAAGRPETALVAWQVWAELDPGALGELQAALAATGHLAASTEEGLGPATRAALASWVSEGCPMPAAASGADAAPESPAASAGPAPALAVPAPAPLAESG